MTRFLSNVNATKTGTTSVAYEDGVGEVICI